MFASFGQNWDLLGWTVYVSSLFGIAGAMATAGFRLPSHRIQAQLRVLLPFIMLFLAYLLRFQSLLGFSRKAYIVQLDSAWIVSCGFATAFSVAALRARDWFSRILGGIAFVLCSLLAFCFYGYTERMFHLQ